MVVVLHNIRSLHNVGSIFRTSDAAGVEKLYLCGITPSPLDRLGAVRSDIIKTALGAEKTVAWEKVASTSRLIDRLKKDGFKILALEQAPNSVPYYEYGDGSRVVARDDRGEENDSRIALILGAEVEGIQKTILQKADTIIEIPMSGTKESLNVSVAFGIVVFRLRDACHCELAKQSRFLDRHGVPRDDRLL